MQNPWIFGDFRGFSGVCAAPDCWKYFVDRRRDLPRTSISAQWGTNCWTPQTLRWNNSLMFDRYLRKGEGEDEITGIPRCGQNPA